MMGQYDCGVAQVAVRASLLSLVAGANVSQPTVCRLEQRPFERGTHVECSAHALRFCCTGSLGRAMITGRMVVVALTTFGACMPSFLSIPATFHTSLA